MVENMISNRSKQPTINDDENTGAINETPESKMQQRDAKRTAGISLSFERSRPNFSTWLDRYNKAKCICTWITDNSLLTNSNKIETCPKNL